MSDIDDDPHVPTFPPDAGRWLPFALTPEEEAQVERMALITDAECNNGHAIRVMKAYKALMLGVALTCPRRSPDGTVVLPPDGVEGWGMVVTGPSLAGKSNVLKGILRDPRLAHWVEDGVARMPMLSLTAPSPSTIKTLGSEMLVKMGAEPPGPRVEEHYIMHRVRRMMIALGVKVVLIDEFQHVLIDRNKGELKRLAETMKNMMKGEPLLVPAKLAARDRRIIDDRSIRHPVHFILAGTPDLGEFAKKRDTHSADQFANKVQITEFKEIEVLRNADGSVTYKGLPEFIRSVVVAMGFPATEADALVTQDMLARFHKGGARQLGRCADLLKRAGILVVTGGKRATLHSKLGEAFEALYATGADKNCFLVPDIAKCPEPPEPVDEATSGAFGRSRRKG